MNVFRVALSTIVLIIAVVLCAIFFVQNNIDNSIKLANQYIINNTDETGRFTYRNSTDKTTVYSGKKYNVLRHAGTIYSMHLSERYLKKGVLEEQISSSAGYLVKNYVRKISPDMYAVVSNPKEEGLKQEEAKLGGAGLALLALSPLYEKQKIDLDIIRGLGNFILYMQQEDGSFVSKYNVEAKKKANEFTSLYYPGEAIYGLLYLNDVNPDKKWVNAAKKGLLHIAKKGLKDGIKVFDHWTLLATKKLMETENNGITDLENKIFQDYTKSMSNFIIEKHIVDIRSPYRGGFYGKKLRLGSAGTIMEGLSAAYSYLDDEDYKKKLYECLKLGNRFLSRHQVKTGECAGGVPGSAKWRRKTSKRADKEIRIDNVQHVMSAWVMFKELSH